MKNYSKAAKKEMVTAFRTREILAAARQVIAQRGVEAATMDGIANAAGVAKGTLYLYFRGKDDLIRALMSQVGENILAVLRAILETAAPPREKLLQILEVLLHQMERERALVPVYLRELPILDREVPQERRRHIRDLEEEIVSLFSRLFAEGVEAGQFIAASPRLLAYIFRGLIRAVGYYQLSEGRYRAVEEAMPVLQTLLLSGLARDVHYPDEVAAP